MAYFLMSSPQSPIGSLPLGLRPPNWSLIHIWMPSFMDIGVRLGLRDVVSYSFWGLLKKSLIVDEGQVWGETDRGNGRPGGGKHSRLLWPQQYECNWLALEQIPLKYHRQFQRFSEATKDFELSGRGRLVRWDGDLCVCHGFDCHELALEQNLWPYHGNRHVYVRIPQILS